MRVLIVGCGYVGTPLGAELVRRGHEVFGLRRNPAAAGELQAEGIRPVFADFTQRDQLESLPRNFDWVVNCAAPGGGTVEGYRALYLEGTNNLLGWLRAHPPRHYVYTSSTSVYGQNDGSWVDEQSATEPGTETGDILVATEQLVLKETVGKFPATILRSTGIYGPGRGYWLRQFLAGEARLEGQGGRFLNMIHRDDLAGSIIAVLLRGRPGQIFNACDCEPVTQRGLYTWLSEQLGRPLPPSVGENPESLRRRAVTNKRISNGLLRREIGQTFLYPSFREGYAAELKRLGVSLAD
ncbi:MAG: SDR family oxidoreductase [Verrucomicrobiota bacterium]